jgi:dual specificity phosphatase 12
MFFTEHYTPEWIFTHKLSMISESTRSDEVCRLLVVGSSKARLGRIFSSLSSTQTSSERLRGNNVHTDILGVRIEYLPCIAKFSSYTNELNVNVRYLESVEYFPHDENGELASTPSSLLPFFDDVTEYRVDSRFPLIAGVAIGSGIEGLDDTTLIDSFIQTMLSGNNNPIHPKIKAINPNPGFSSMRDELTAYKNLSPQEKDEANRHHTMGPEKMVSFVIDFASELILEALNQNQQQSETLLDDILTPQINDVDTKAKADPSHFIDPTKERYFCRICRTSLFGEEDLQDPPHEASRHQFSHRKIQHGVVSTSLNSGRCQSYFLRDSLEWMGNDICNGVSEGKFNCPNCAAKIGTWIWSGTQCSCGTWVVPAIQIPKSKVDVVKPIIADTTQEMIS